jgi:Fe-S cluster assembly protein SufD
MTSVMEERDLYLASFAAFEKRVGDRGPLHKLRQAAIERFAALGFPTLEDEDWRFTNLAPLAKVPFELADASTAHPVVEYDGALPAGVVVGTLAEALAKHPELVEPHLAKYADYEEHAFRALNTAFLHDGAFVYLPPGKVVEQPLYVRYRALQNGRPAVRHPRCLVVASRHSQLRLVEHFEGDGVHFTNAVTEVFAGEGAFIDHYKLLREGREASHIATTRIQQERTSNFASHAVLLGGGLVRNEVHAVLAAEGCECTLNGLYMGGGRQHLDNFTVIDHTKPHCASHELYKGILDGQAHGVFSGRIYVRPDAQKTDAKQTNQTLLLSDDATINTKPQLEIYADDVKCTHGATVGQLDATALFYLRSRGIDLESARRLLTYAFANDIIGRIKVEPLRLQLDQMLLAAQHLPRDETP